MTAELTADEATGEAAATRASSAESVAVRAACRPTTDAPVSFSARRVSRPSPGLGPRGDAGALRFATATRPESTVRMSASALRSSRKREKSASVSSTRSAVYGLSTR